MAYLDKMKSKSSERCVVYRTREYVLNPNNFSDLILFGTVKTGVPTQIEIGEHLQILNIAWASARKTKRNGKEIKTSRLIKFIEKKIIKVDINYKLLLIMLACVRAL